MFRHHKIADHNSVILDFHIEIGKTVDFPCGATRDVWLPSLDDRMSYAMLYGLGDRLIYVQVHVVSYDVAASFIDYPNDLLLERVAEVWGGVRADAITIYDSVLAELEDDRVKALRFESNDEPFWLQIEFSHDLQSRSTDDLRFFVNGHRVFENDWLLLTAGTVTPEAVRQSIYAFLKFVHE